MRHGTYGTMRHATEADFDDLYTLYMDSLVNRFLVFDPMPPGTFREVFDSFIAERDFYVYEEAGSIVAALTVTRGSMRMKHVATLGTVAVHLDEHGSGIGSVFLSKVLAKLASEGMRRVDLTVDADNEAGIEFYRRLGFHSEGVLHDYIRREGSSEYVDNIMMVALLE